MIILSLRMCAVLAARLNFAPIEASVQGERVPCTFAVKEFSEIRLALVRYL
jgi:hypothetical protein